MSVEEQNEFLGTENKEILNKIFGTRRVGGKLKIGVGLHVLTLKVKKKEMGFYGEQMVLKFWKPPISVPNLVSSISHHYIQCIHVLREKRTIPFKGNWHKPFTTCLDEKSFEVVKQGQKFLCLVGIEEGTFFERNGELATYSRGNRAGNKVVTIKPYIKSVHPLDAKVDFKYYELYKKLDDESRD